MSRASSDALDLIHGLVASSLVDQLRAAKAARDEQGKPVPIPAALIQNAMKFLKDNGIDAPASAERLNDLTDELRDLDFDEPHLIVN